ncbi:putative RNA-binding protein (Contains KH domain) [Hyella patelloides LEGE 07179]|uniref:Putative RNA-binding protein (Contains KH domain) n=1 Tax=Hyella patelloides LEGE 07179 TaxID=945734 RepID=A0A563W5M5_9CYAN|nr:KH domain-containing protein [Hyella patelloides]VEP18843.1 putative RNA-binding protein (Contains KH domain) [Hyella patelloides LEGE 07179]
MPREIDKSASQEVSSPDYVGLVKFLIEPFLEETESLHIDCEHLTSSSKVWLRVAFDTADKGKVFGRGGRNIQAVGTILKTAANNANQFLHLDVYNSDRDLAKSKSQYKKRSRPRPPEKNQVIL